VNSTNTSWINRLWQHIVRICAPRAGSDGNVTSGTALPLDGNFAPNEGTTATPSGEVAPLPEAVPRTDVRLGRDGFAGDRGSFRLGMVLIFILGLCVLATFNVLLVQGVVTPEDIYTMVRAFTPLG